MNTVKKAAFITAAAAGVLAAGMGAANASADTDGAAVKSPGVVSGNNIQVPVHVPVNLCGNSVNIVGLINPTFGNTCINQG
jgi:small secreted domain DUF320